MASDPPQLAVILPTIGRATADRARDSIMAAGFWTGYDWEIVVADNPPHNDYGGWARNVGLDALRDMRYGDWVCYLDDDDVYLPGALAAVRATLADRDPTDPELHIFRARFNDSRVKTAPDGCLWIDREIRRGNISTCMLVHSLAPLPPGLRWRTDVYEHDYHLAADLVDAGYAVHWHETVIASVRPAEEGQ
jgi:glycosyltransferase involved in cell wall biosynthesis